MKKEQFIGKKTVHKKRTVHRKKRTSKKSRANKTRKQRGGGIARYDNLMKEKERNNPLSYWVKAENTPLISKSFSNQLSNVLSKIKPSSNKTPAETHKIELEPEIIKAASGLKQTVWPWNVRVPLPEGAPDGETGNLVSFTFRESDKADGLPFNFIKVFLDIYETHQYKTKNGSSELILTTIDDVKAMALGVYPIYLDWKAKFYKATPDLKEPPLVQKMETPNGEKIVDVLCKKVSVKENNNLNINDPERKAGIWEFNSLTYDDVSFKPIKAPAPVETAPVETAPAPSQ
jgi:hypothetical protein